MGFKLDAVNRGPESSPGVFLVAGFPPPLEFVEAFKSPEISCQQQGREVVCQLGPMRAGTVRAVVLRARLSAEARGIASSWGSVTSIGIDPVITNNLRKSEILIAGSADFNGDLIVDAADLQLLILEMNDGDGEQTSDVSGGSFIGDPGMDLNLDGRIDLGDVQVLIRFIFASTR